MIAIRREGCIYVCADPSHERKFQQHAEIPIIVDRKRNKAETVGCHVREVTRIIFSEGPQASPTCLPHARRRGDDSWSIELHATVSALEVPNSGGIRAEAKTGPHGESRTSREKSRYKKGLDGLAENEWKDHPQASPAANEQAKQANNPSAIHRFKASSDCTRDTMKLSVFTALSALFLAAAATPARSRVLVCNMPSGCTNLGGCNFCCDNTPSGCHLHGPPYETCNGNMGIVVHCEPH
ncbi:predicted protein [Coccidioides posadasii str. Silveira]|uniref:Predicted protein n=1 Tax=Coccidioides posadasii (strain RMSCC 757 / Silveira) TaxID=443226 RepID=E9D5P8_COCPS|nr:predicted protein [Coccidioides posadasii str. Silveira]